MDGGCLVEGYESDVTRTSVFGKATDEMHNVFDTVFKAQSAALAFAKPGVRRNKSILPHAESSPMPVSVRVFQIFYTGWVMASAWTGMNGIYFVPGNKRQMVYTA